MTTDFTILSSYRNKDKVEYLVQEIRNRGYTCYNFCDKPADPNNADAHPEEQMKVFEADRDFYADKHFQMLFEKDMAGLKKASTVILLQPCGLSAHMEAGIAYGLGKPLIMIGKPVKPETLYLMFKTRYSTVEEFLRKVDNNDNRIV